MNQKQNIRGFVWLRLMTAGFLVFAFLLGMIPQASAAQTAQANQTTVRVGYFYNGDFLHKEADGSYSGYDAEFYYTLAGYANWKVEFVEYPNLNAATAGLEKGEIDVMSGLSQTEERVNRFLVSAKKMCTAQIAVQVRADDDRFAIGDTESMKGLSCGILKGSNVVKLYTDWCVENGLTPHVREYNSLDERNAALLAGKVDAIAGGSTIVGTQKIAEFPSLDLYFMLNRQRTDLKTQLDRAMSILDLEDPSYATALFMKYFPASRNNEPSFSAKEKKYLKEHDEIYVGVLSDDEPFSRKTETGNAEGILPAYFDHFSQVTGSKFICKPFATTEEELAALHEGKIDMIGKFGSNTIDANKEQVILTIPYLQLNMVEIMKKGDGQAKSVAVPQCSALQIEEAMASQKGKADVAICKSCEKCFELLKHGKVDSIICPQPAATWLLSRSRVSNYIVLAFGDKAWDVVCALPHGESSNTLRSIMNKSVAADGSFIHQLITSETLKDSAEFSTFIDRLPVSYLVGAVIVAGVLLTIAVAALIILVKRRKTERQIELRQAALAAAEDANRAKHEFFGAVSHDMRTPLNGIMGYTDLALGSGDTNQIKEYLGKIKKSGSILCSLVDDTLIMSRMESEKYRLNLTPVDTAEVLGEVLEPIRALAAEKGVTLKEDVAASRPRMVMADRVSLQKVLLNLLSNAVRFTPPGGTVTFCCRLDPPEGGEPDSIITVSDTGSGIGKDFLPKLFEPFAQEYPGNTDATGSGMGLAVVKRIIDAMGGTIEVKSEKGKGTTFVVRAHLKETDRSSMDGKETLKKEELRLKGKRALVCEDNPLNMEILCTILQKFGMETVRAANGKAGVEIFAGSAPGWLDVVLMDLRMPVMDGVSAAYAMRALHRADAGKIPILAVSADAFEEDIEKCREAGMNGHLAKPINPGCLYRLLVRSIFPGEENDC